MKRTVWALALLFTAIGALEILELQVMQPLENRLMDRFVRSHAAALEPDPDIVIVDIDESSLARMQDVAGRWPWPRSVHAELVQGLAAQKPAAIVFDLLFSEHDVDRPEADALWVETLRETEKVYLPTQLLEPADGAHGVRLAELQDALGLQAAADAFADARAILLAPTIVPPELWRTGLINYLEDADGIGRRYLLRRELAGWQIPSLPARVARDLGYAVEGNELLLHWRGGVGAHRHVPYADLYEDFGRRERQRQPDEFRNKIVIVGTAAAGLHDLRATPIATLYPGVEMLATALDNLKNGQRMQTAPLTLPLALLAGLIAGLALLAQRRRPLAGGMLLLAGAVAALGYSAQAVAGYRIVPLLTPLVFAAAFFVCTTLLNVLHERRSREQAVKLFGRFLNPEVVDRIVERGETIESLTGKTREVTVLFSDIRGFTTLSELRPPQEVVSLLNRYFSRQVAVVFRHGGTLDKFIGDCIMAFWGAPLDDPQHARHAVAAALEMEEVLLRFREELGAEAAGFDVGIGIHSGTAVAGFIGAEQKLEYTVIGDCVNLASRIEGLTKGVGARILVSAQTRAGCGDIFDFESQGTHKVKGRDEPVELFTVRSKGAIQ
jgi:adenylate cyclase